MLQASHLEDRVKADRTWKARYCAAAARRAKLVRIIGPLQTKGPDRRQIITSCWQLQARPGCCDAQCVRVLGAKDQRAHQMVYVARKLAMRTTESHGQTLQIQADGQIRNSR